LSVPLLANIWSGNIIFWDDPAIAALNPDISLPHEAIVLVFGDDGRGTISDVFASALADFEPAFVLAANESFADSWSQFGSINGRSLVVPSGPVQLGSVAVRPLAALPAASLHSPLTIQNRPSPIA
jgi:hypothetical protein